MTTKKFEQEGLFRFQIIAPLINRMFPKGELKEAMEKAAEQYYEHPVKGYQRFAYKTIEEWYYLYKQHGFSGLERRTRKDRGVAKSISQELGEFILNLKRENPRRSARQIIKELVTTGKIRPGEISRSSVYRLFVQHRLELKQMESGTHVELKKYEFARSNECWQSDVSYGPHLDIKGHPRKKRIFLYAFLDDASRLIPHAGIFLAENLENLIEVLKTALLKKGIPERLYLDNASYFRSPQLQKIGAWLGMRVMYCTPYSPYKKGKIERFWGTLKGQFLSTLDKHKCYELDELNRLLMTWIEQDYHHEQHAALGKSPLAAWQEKAGNIRYPDPEQLQRDFLHEETRRVRKDGTIMLNGIYYEVGSFYAGESVTVRYDPFHQGTAYIYLKGKYMREAAPVNQTENQKTHRQKPDFQQNHKEDKDHV